METKTFKKNADGSIIDETGRVIFFSGSRFYAEIVEGDCCYVCGRDQAEVKFNREHILPQWVLRRFNLHSRSVTLPNGTTFKYGEYVLPCCMDCNALMGRELESVIQPLIEAGASAVAHYLQEYGPGLFFIWLSNIFLKTHLKDTSLLLNRDRRSGVTETIGDTYDFSTLHHTHCIARAPYTGATIDAAAFGSIFVLEAKVNEHYESFDFVDLYQSKSILIRIGNVCFIAVLDDGCGAFSAFMDDLKRIAGPLSPLQLREFLAHVSYINLHLRERANFYSTTEDGEYRISGNSPTQVQLDDDPARPVSEIIYGLCKDMLVGHPKAEEILPALKEGHWQFLFDGNGKFQSDSMELTPSESSIDNGKSRVGMD